MDTHITCLTFLKQKHVFCHIPQRSHNSAECIWKSANTPVYFNTWLIIIKLYTRSRIPDTMSLDAIITNRNTWLEKLPRKPHESFHYTLFTANHSCGYTIVAILKPYFTCISWMVAEISQIIQVSEIGTTQRRQYSLPRYKNKERDTAHTIVSWPNPKQWQMGHTSDLLMPVAW